MHARVLPAAGGCHMPLTPPFCRASRLRCPLKSVEPGCQLRPLPSPPRHCFPPPLRAETHPDRGGDAERFRRINNAHEILGDPEKRAIYDKHGEEAARDGGGGGGHRGAATRSRKGEDIQRAMTVSLDDLFNGKVRPPRGLPGVCLCYCCVLLLCAIGVCVCVRVCLGVWRCRWPSF